MNMTPCTVRTISKYGRCAVCVVYYHDCRYRWLSNGKDAAGVVVLYVLLDEGARPLQSGILRGDPHRCHSWHCLANIWTSLLLERL